MLYPDLKHWIYRQNHDWLFHAICLCSAFMHEGWLFIDLAYLTKENIQGEYIIYRRHKTGQELSIKLEICLKTIIDRYSHYSNGTFLFPVLSESTQNYDSALRLHNIHLKKILRLQWDFPNL